MGGAVPPLPQYAFMAWFSEGAQGQLYLLPVYKMMIKLTSLLHSTNKFLSNILPSKLKSYVDKIIGDFEVTLSTDQIFCIRQILVLVLQLLKSLCHLIY